MSLKLFKNEELGSIRTLNIKGFPYFVGTDIAKALGYKNSHDAVRRHCEEVVKYNILTKGGPQKMNCILEDDVIRLIAKSETKAHSYKELFLNYLKKEKLINSRFAIQTRAEIEFIDMLMKILKPFELKMHKQQQVLGYKVDLYIEDIGVAIEYDENNHKNYNEIMEQNRELKIKEELDCIFIRVSGENSHLWNCGYVIKKIGAKINGQ